MMGIAHMEEEKTKYNTRGNRVMIEVSPEIYKVVQWIERNNKGRWIGTLIYVEDTNTYQMFDGKAAGVASQNGR